MVPSKLKKLLCLSCLLVFSTANASTSEEFRKFLEDMGGKARYAIDLIFGSGKKQLIEKLFESEWVNLEYKVINVGSGDQFIMQKDKNPLFVNNFTSSWIRIMPEALVPEKTFQAGQLLTPIKNGAATIYTVGKLQYYYHTYQTNITTVQFKVVTNTPTRTQRDCILKFHVSSKGPMLNSYLNVVMDPENSKYKETCEARVETDSGALKHNCGWWWCERPRDIDYAKVNIIIYPPGKVALTKLVPACSQNQNSQFPDHIYAYIDSNPKDFVRKTEDYTIAPELPLCPRGTWKIQLPANFTFEKFRFDFTKPLQGHQDAASNYDIVQSPEITGWPAARDIKHAKSCIYDAKSSCDLDIVPTSVNNQPAVIKTPPGKSTTVTITNNSSYAKMVPTFTGWSVTPYKKPN